MGDLHHFLTGHITLIFEAGVAALVIGLAVLIYIFLCIFSYIEELRDRNSSLKKSLYDLNREFEGLKEILSKIQRPKYIPVPNSTPKQPDIRVTPAPIPERPQGGTIPPTTKIPETKYMGASKEIAGKAVFTDLTNSIEVNSYFKATINSDEKAHFELIDINRVKSCDSLTDAVSYDNHIQIVSASGFKTVKTGTMHKESDIWYIDSKTEIKLM